MKKNLILLLGVVSLFFSCSSNEADNTKYLNQISQLEKENKELKETLEQVKYPASDRLNNAKQLISENKFDEALTEIDNLYKIFPKSKEASELEKLRKSISDRQIKIKQEEDRIKALGFKVLKEESTVNIGYNKISVGGFSTAQTFTVDSYDDSYRYFTADRGNKYISARISITSSDKDPMLPVFYAYSVNGDKLERIGNFILRFARWRDYGTYLGNNHDNGNDFAKTSTIPFKIGIEVSDDIAKSPLIILVKDENCMVRNYDRFSNPPVSYEAGSCHSHKELSIEDLKEDYIVVKILNKNKL